MAIQDLYFSGQGNVYIGTRSGSGQVDTFREVGNVPALRVTMETDVLEHKESRTGQRLTDLRLLREKRARVSITMENFSKANLMMLLYGTSSTLTGTSVTNETFPTSLAVGDIVTLDNVLIASSPAPVITDSAGTPATLSVGTHYRILDYAAGLIEMVNVTGFTQPFKAAYTFETQDSVALFRENQVERFLRFSGLNTANTIDADKPVIVELYRVIFDPAGNLDLISDELAQFEIEGSILYDATRVGNTALGGFGRIIETPAA